MHNKTFIFIISLIFFGSCQTEHLPKPKGGLRLDYDLPKYHLYENGDCPYSFDINDEAVIKKESGCDIDIQYPKMKATLYLSYKPIHKNIDRLLRDAQKLTYEHTIKADNIVANTFVNDTTSVYGTFYEVTGDAASQAQFYVTDSTHYFLAGSVYFNAKPNYDSVQPAAAYLKNDLRKLMESLRWKK